MYRDWYNEKTGIERYIVVRFGKFIAPDDIGTIRDKVYIFPAISFFFNRREFCLSFYFLTFKAYYYRKNYSKPRHEKRTF